MRKILLAGSTGYLGSYILKELSKRGIGTKIIVRNPEKLNDAGINHELTETLTAEVTHPKSIANCCENIDTVISTIGITRQKDGLTYMDVDYQANANLLNEAKKSGVRKFIYVSALNGDKLRHLKIFAAKERFVDELTASGLSYTIMRPNGFFSDMGDFLNMAKGGKVYLFGDGQFKLNPIHGADLAEVCVDAITSDEQEINIGGPEMLTQNEIAELALKAWSKKIKIAHLPDWIRKLTIWTVRTFSSSMTYGPIEFFLTAMSFDNIAPKYGVHRLEDYFNMQVKEETTRL